MAKFKSLVLAKKRMIIQVLASFLCNIHIGNFLKGEIYRGGGKRICLPGLNCYSCPAANFACPIGAYQAVAGSKNFKISYYVGGVLIFTGFLLGRFVCGFLCPFGLLQEILYKIPTKKFSSYKFRVLRYLKYIILALFVVTLPVFITNDLGMGNPFFCKYICPAGILEGAIPLSLVNESIRASLGTLFSLKLAILIVFVILSIVFFRPFCKWLCPLGGFYGLFNKVSLFKMGLDKSKCISCNKCVKACKMDVNVRKDQNHSECIRCGMCIKACPTRAIKYDYGFYGKKGEDDE